MGIWDFMIFPVLILVGIGGFFLDRKNRTKQNDIQKTYEEWKNTSFAQSQEMLKNQEKQIALLQEIRDSKKS